VRQVHAFLRKRYAFFDREGLRVDEDIDDEEDEDAAGPGASVVETVPPVKPSGDVGVDDEEDSEQPEAKRVKTK
jgi:hypothetical protein